MQLVANHTQERLETLHPEAASEIGNLERTISNCGVDPGLLALCQEFFHAELNGNAWEPARELTVLESACVKLCEQFSVSVANLEADHVAPLAAELDADQLYNLMSAIYLIEASTRLEVTLGRVLG